ncbi:hypothetical protein [Spirulina major]|uniref:hypothetical protein n=1 Tax=Spirulina major TaxID=270636 RepID=UPI0009355E3F|nr:hypothetical protein [Spirulina major]
MLDITFYGDAATEPRVIECSTSFFERLAQSDFAEIGSSQAMVLSVEGDDYPLQVVPLEKGLIPNRQRFREFFKEWITQESATMLSRLGDAPTKGEYLAASYGLRKLHEILNCVEDRSYLYLERV